MEKEELASKKREKEKLKKELDLDGLGMPLTINRLHRLLIHNITGDIFEGMESDSDSDLDLMYEEGGDMMGANEPDVLTQMYDFYVLCCVMLYCVVLCCVDIQYL